MLKRMSILWDASQIQWNNEIDEELTGTEAATAATKNDVRFPDCDDVRFTCI
jgi:hypothetical protein